jgi:hypothetical protein
MKRHNRMDRRYTRTNGEVRTYAYSDFQPTALMACRAALRVRVGNEVRMANA